ASSPGSMIYNRRGTIAVPVSKQKTESSFARNFTAKAIASLDGSKSLKKESDKAASKQTDGSSDKKTSDVVGKEGDKNKEDYKENKNKEKDDSTKDSSTDITSSDNKENVSVTEPPPPPPPGIGAP